VLLSATGDCRAPALRELRYDSYGQPAGPLPRATPLTGQTWHHHFHRRRNVGSGVMLRGGPTNLNLTTRSAERHQGHP